jgi:hypothetical protein
MQLFARQQPGRPAGPLAALLLLLFCIKAAAKKRRARTQTQRGHSIVFIALFGRSSTECAQEAATL